MNALARALSLVGNDSAIEERISLLKEALRSEKLREQRSQSYWDEYNQDREIERLKRSKLK